MAPNISLVRVVRYAFLAEIEKPFLFLHSLGRLQPWLMKPVAARNKHGRKDTEIASHRGPNRKALLHTQSGLSRLWE
jgi:hypothetical protein